MSLLVLSTAINSFHGKPSGIATSGSKCVLFDSMVENMSKSMFPDWPWGPGNNPKTAVHAFLSTHPEFVIDADIHNKLLITVAPDRYLKRLSTSTGNT
jgi:cephalosporin hydroxylase